MDLREKVAVITGGRRIGASVAVELARRGAHVSLSYRTSSDAAAAAAKEVERCGRSALITQADLSDPAACEGLIESTVKRLGGLQVVINMASTYMSTAFDELTGSHLTEALQVDLNGTYVCSLAAVPHIRRAGGGHIVNFSDWTAASGRPRYEGFLPYYVAKTAVIGLTEAMALELASDSILVNAIAPGPIRPPTRMDSDEVAAVSQATPLGKWGGDEEIVKAVISLLESDFVTGQTIRVDGGRHLK